MSTISCEMVDMATVTNTHICEGEEVITGGPDGQVWVATFADARLAAAFVKQARGYPGQMVWGVRAHG